MPTAIQNRSHGIMADDRRYAREVAERQCAMFVSFVGHGRHTTFAALEAASGYPESTLRGYAGGAAMPVSALLALSDHLPRAAINMITEVGGKRLTDAEKSETNWDSLAAKTAGMTSAICEARADGQIDHVEKAILKQTGRELLAELAHAVEEG
jgi:hypothetical protein